MGPSEDGPFTHIPSITRMPTLYDPVGTNVRNPQSRNLTVTIRGGGNNVILLRQLPTIAVTIRMDMSVKDFFADTFVANVALLLNIAPSRIVIAAVRVGSVIVDFNIAPAVSVAASHQDVVDQVTELHQLAQNLTTSVTTGALQEHLNVTIMNFQFSTPPIPTVVNSTSTHNTTSANAQTVPPVMLITSPPTIAPSSVPTLAPVVTPRPTAIPTSIPTNTLAPTTTQGSAPSNSVVVIVVAVVLGSVVLMLGTCFIYWRAGSTTKLASVLPAKVGAAFAVEDA